MQILFLAMSLLLVSLPIRTQHLYRAAYDWERKQIAVDNAAIRLGQGQRSVLRWLERAGRLLRAMDQVHHPIHLCAQTAVVGAKCIAQDVALEWEIKHLHRQAAQIARQKWRYYILVAHTELERLGAKLCGLKGPRTIPIRSRYCSLCGLPIGWKVVERDKLAFVLEACHSSPSPIRSGVKLQKGITGRDRWNYRLYQVSHAEKKQQWFSSL